MHERVLSDRKSFPRLLCFRTPGCDSHYCKLKVVNLLKYAEVSGCPLRPGEFTCAQSCTVNTPQVQLQEAPRPFQIPPQSERVQCTHGAAEKPGKVRREAAAALQECRVPVGVSAPRCCSVCRCVGCLPLSLHLSATFLP